jgi:hypothetical protein
MSTIYLGAAASVQGTNFDLSGCSVTLTTDPSNNYDVVNKKYADDIVTFQADRITDVLAEAGEYLTIKSVIDLIGTKDTDLLNKIDMLFLQFFHKNSENASISNNQIYYKTTLIIEPVINFSNIATYSGKNINNYDIWNINTPVNILAGQTLIIPINIVIQNNTLWENYGTIILNKNDVNDIYDLNGSHFYHNNGGIINNNIGGIINNTRKDVYIIGIINNNGGIINNYLGGEIRPMLKTVLTVVVKGTINNNDGGIINNYGNLIINGGILNNNIGSTFENFKYMSIFPVDGIIKNYAILNNNSVDSLIRITGTKGEFHNLGNGILTTGPGQYLNSGKFYLAASASLVGTINNKQPIPV